MGGVFIGPYSAYCLILPCSHYKKNHFSLQKCRKIRDFNVNFLKIFWGHSPTDPHTGEADPTLPPRLSGASRLLASLGTFGPSIDALDNNPPPAIPGSATDSVIGLIIGVGDRVEAAFPPPTQRIGKIFFRTNIV